MAFIDGGAIGLLDRRQRSALQAVLIAIVAQDAARLRDALRPMTTASKTIDERALGVVLVDHLGARVMLGAEVIAALMGVMREFGLALEPIVGGALRALTTLQHTLELLAPDFDLIAEAKTYGQALASPLWVATQSGSAREELEALLPGPSASVASGRPC